MTFLTEVHTQNYASAADVTKINNRFNGLLHGKKFRFYDVDTHVLGFRTPSRLADRIYTVSTTLAGVAVGFMAWAKFFS